MTSQLSALKLSKLKIIWILLSMKKAQLSYLYAEVKKKNKNKQTNKQRV